MSLAPLSTQIEIDIAQLQKSFLGSPRSNHGTRKSLPPLPPMAEIKRDAAEARALENDRRRSVRTGSRQLSPVPSGLNKALPRPFAISAPRSLSPLSRETPIPTTASTRSFTSVDPKRDLKYGVGKHSMVELSPQPSEDPNDPLNWPLWKKNLNFIALLSIVGIVGAMKTALVSVYSALTVEQDISYTSAVALTAIPLIVSAVAGMSSTILARVWGKRPVYLVSAMLMFVGSAWNMSTALSFAQNSVARTLQGLGWGAFDTLVLGSILDTFFEHERQSKILLYNTVFFGTTWGAPLIGGAASMNSRGSSTQFTIFTALLVVFVPLLILGAPETTYKRSSFDTNDAFPALTRSQSRLPNITFSKYAVLQYLRSIKFQSYKAINVDRALLMQAPRAAAAPSVMLLMAVTLLPYASLWGLTSSLSMLFAQSSFSLTESAIGLMFLAPFLVGTSTAAIPSVLLRKQNFSRTTHFVTLIVGTTFASIGMLSFGLYIVGSAHVRGPSGSVVFAEDNSISFPIISFLLGLLALGLVLLDSTIQPVIEASTAFTSANMNIALRNIADMQAGVACLRNLVAGIFVLGLPTVVRTLSGLRGSAIGFAVVQIFVAGGAAAVYVVFGQDVRRLDGIVMGLVDLSSLRQRDSFYDVN
ncbi:hypothetical protein F4777DRAFT_152993 [Nemania sp. FL0916]|nr:hypothetical protein F4777DRAFT_152993 [Nemania sp. FL0916]